MPYVPKYQLAAEGLFIDNVLAIFARDFKPCLDVLYPTEAALLSSNPAFLADFAERTFGTFMRLGFPALVADLVEGDDEESEHRDDQSIVIGLSLAVTDLDESNITRRLAKYVRALRVVLFSAPWTDYTVGVTSTKIAALNIEKLSRKYFPIGQGKDDFAVYGYMRSAEFRLTLSFSER